MSDSIYQRAWGHYISLLEFLVDKGTPRSGDIQPFNLATPLPYTKQHSNYDLFLLQSACNYVAPRVPVEDRSDDSRNDQNLSHNDKLTDAYSTFLVELDDLLLREIDPTKKVEYEKFKNELELAQRNHNDYVTFVHDRWAEELARRSIPSDQIEAERVIFERDRSYSAELERRRAIVRAASGRVNAFLRKATPKEFWRLVDAKGWFEDPGYQILLPTVAAFDTDAKKQYWSRFHLQTLEFDLEEFLQNSAERNREFKTEREEYSRVEEKWQVSAGAKWGLFSGGGSAERRRLEEISQKKHFSFKLTAKRIEEISIFRGRWYQDVLFETVGNEFPQYWGPSGLLGAIPYSLIVARGLTIEVKLEEEYRKTVEDFVRGSATFGFGPFFSSSASGHRDAKYMTFTKTGDGFQLADSDTTVRLLGARVRRFNWNDEAARLYHTPLVKSDLTRINFKKR